jgi:hypothetical protein
MIKLLERIFNFRGGRIRIVGILFFCLKLVATNKIPIKITAEKIPQFALFFVF